MTGRSIADALMRGTRRKCPNCGTGSLFEGFLTARTTCLVCGEDLSHQRADDAPPYVVTLIVGHVVVGLMLSYEMAYSPPMWLHAAIFLPLTLIMSLGLLRPVKGGLIGFQWAAGTHGFAPDGERWT